MTLTPQVKKGDWLSIRQAINKLKFKLGPISSPTFAGVTLTDMTQGSVLFVGANGLISQDNSNLFWDDTNKRLGLGTNEPGYAVHMMFDEVQSGVTIQRADDTVSAPFVYFLKQRGTFASPTTLYTNDEIMKFAGYGWNVISEGWSAIAQIVCRVDASPDADGMSGRIEFYTSPTGSNTLEERMRITQAGYVGINNNAPTVALDVTGAITATGTGTFDKLDLTSTTTYDGITTHNTEFTIQNLKDTTASGFSFAANTGDIAFFAIYANGNTGSWTPYLYWETDVAGRVSMRSDVAIDFMPSNDNTDYIRFQTVSNVPEITTLGNCDLKINASSNTITSTSSFTTDDTISGGTLTDGTLTITGGDLTTSGRVITTGGDPVKTGKFLTGNAGNTVFSFSGNNFDIRAGDGTSSSQNVMRVDNSGDFDFYAGNLTTTGSGRFDENLAVNAAPVIGIGLKIETSGRLSYGIEFINTGIDAIDIIYGISFTLDVYGYAMEGYGVQEIINVREADTLGIGIRVNISTPDIDDDRSLYGIYITMEPRGTAHATYGEYIEDDGYTISDPTVDQIGLYLDWSIPGTDFSGNKWAIKSVSSEKCAFGGNVRIGSTAVPTEALHFADAKNIAFDTTTGTKIGTSASQKLAFYNTTPVVQNQLATGVGKTVDNVITELQRLGLVRQAA